MNKKYFGIGFLSGCLVFILLSTLLLNKLTLQPNIILDQIDVESINGKEEQLSNYIGKPIVINYWATWCIPCIKEFPYFEEVKQELGDSIHFIMISDESNEKIKAFSEKNNYTFNYLRSKINLEEYGISIRPTTYFYNSNGELLSKHAGSLEKSTLKELIENIEAN